MPGTVLSLGFSALTNPRLNRYDAEENVQCVSSMLNKIESFQKIATDSICVYIFASYYYISMQFAIQHPHDTCVLYKGTVSQSPHAWWSRDLIIYAEHEKLQKIK